MNGQNRWLYLIKRMVYRFFDDGIPQSAAELSYFLLFSMFPLLMFVNSMLAQLDLSIEGMQPVLEMLPKSLQQLIGGYIQQLIGTPSFSPMIVGLGLTLYFLSRAVRSMMRTVNDIYHVEISRGMVKDVLISFGITAGFLVSVVCSFVLVVAGRTIIRVVPKYLPVKRRKFWMPVQWKQVCKVPVFAVPQYVGSFLSHSPDSLEFSWLPAS